MAHVVNLSGALDAGAAAVGGKAANLARLAAGGFAVPETVCVTVSAYREFLEKTGLSGRVGAELSRRDLVAARWEELWDAALRIRNHFLHTPVPEGLARELEGSFAERFGERPVCVRSSAPVEDSVTASFAGLHDSFVNVRGAGAVLRHVRLVWASLFSDRALLYRRELSLDPRESVMAVVVQELVSGAASGVAFTRNPQDPETAVIEAVHGLNEGLVDGSVTPDRWILARPGGRVVAHHPAVRKHYVVASPEGTTISPLPAGLSSLPPLSPPEVARVHAGAMRAEALFGAPQDVEWTLRGGEPVLLQSRPVTTSPEAGAGAPLWKREDQRAWYFTLTRSLESLKSLRATIEGELLPRMVRDAREMAATDPARLPDTALAAEIERRAALHAGWVETYWRDFIPFAHGIRLFGQAYNDAVAPGDPYEFMDALRGAPLEGVRRNGLLSDMAETLRGDPELRARLERREEPPPGRFSDLLARFVTEFGALSCSAAWCAEGPWGIVGVVLEMANHPKRAPAPASRPDPEALAAAFLGHFPGEKRRFAEDVLDIGRAAFRLRDDDNIHLGRIEGRALDATEEGRRRLAARGVADVAAIAPGEVAEALRNPAHEPRRESPGASRGAHSGFSPRPAAPETGPPATGLLTGQPAGPGVARGPARVVREPAELFAFRSGEVLVCDALDPNMTFVVPLAAGIVERRGGMLIHGAIIAREYGIPCVTGIGGAITRIATGDLVTVDGYRGEVFVSPASEGQA